VILAILDTGMPMEDGELSHPDLSGARFTSGVDAVNQHEARDDHGHGTHVAGIAAAERNNGIGLAGLWPGRVYAAKVFDARNRGSDLTFDAGVAAAVDFAAASGARLVINYSGYVKVNNGILRSAVKKANDAGALLVCAAGNEKGGKVRYPAAYAPQNEGVIAAAAIERAGELSALSSKGPEVTLGAPGDQILSALPNYAVTWNTEEKKVRYYDYSSGTSMACSFVAGVAALVWSQKPSASAAEVRAHLGATAQKSSAELGYGIIDAGKAVETSL
jgi:subtilisin family serine protease